VFQSIVTERLIFKIISKINFNRTRKQFKKWA